MRRLITILCLVLTIQSVTAQLKSEATSETHSAEMRVNAGFTKKFKSSGVFINFNEEIRSRLYESTDGTLANPAAYFRVSYTTVDLSYRPLPYLKVGAAYTLKLFGNKQMIDSRGDLNGLRHRVNIHANGSYETGQWKFSLRERLDINIRHDSVNVYEQPKTELRLKHRLGALYSIPAQPVKVYTWCELVNTLNASTEYLNQQTGGNYGQYLSDVRAQLGVRWRLNRENTLDFAYRFSYGYDRDLNVTKNKQLIELTHEKSFMHVLSIAYEFEW